MCDRLKSAVDAKVNDDFVLMARTDAVAALDGKVASGGRLNLLKTLSDPDGIPPANSTVTYLDNDLRINRGTTTSYVAVNKKLK